MPRHKGFIRPYSSLLIQINRVVDALWISASLLGIMMLGPGWNTDAIWLALLAVLIFGYFAELNRLYRAWRVAPLHEELSVIWSCWFTTALAVVFILYVFDDLFRPVKPLTLAWLALTPVLLSVTRVVARLALRSMRRAGRNFRISAVIGANETGRRIADRILQNRWMGIRLIGYFDDRSPHGERPLVDGPVPIAGNVDDIVKQAEAGEIDSIFIALPMRAENRVKQLVERLADSMALVYYVADFSVFDLLHAQWETLGEIPVLRIIDTPFKGFNGFAKRLLDIGLSSLLLILLSLPMLAIALAIKLTSSGPVIYGQIRNGLDGHDFTIYKFRTMATAESSADFKQATRNDPRVTALGRFLRRASLDELPQLINVLQGRMSLVGPRPHPLQLNEQHRYLIRRFVLRHKVRPGITGWAQVNGCRGETKTLGEMQQRLKYDLEYIDTWSFWLDLRILFLTVIRVWHDRRAY